MGNHIKHKDLHSAENLYCCGVCNKTFILNITMIGHLKIYSGKEEPVKPPRHDFFFFRKIYHFLGKEMKTINWEQVFLCIVD